MHTRKNMFFPIMKMDIETSTIRMIVTKSSTTPIIYCLCSNDVSISPTSWSLSGRESMNSRIDFQFLEKNLSTVSGAKKQRRLPIKMSIVATKTNIKFN